METANGVMQLFEVFASAVRGALGAVVVARPSVSDTGAQRQDEGEH
jgi:hypothetical protein